MSDTASQTNAHAISDTRFFSSHFLHTAVEHDVLAAYRYENAAATDILASTKRHNLKFR